MVSPSYELVPRQELTSFRYFCNSSEGGNLETPRNILPTAVKEFFRNQAFCCYEYEELTPATEETMFQLVQKGVTITPAEKMRAMSTEWAVLTKEFEDEYTTVLNRESFLHQRASLIHPKYRNNTKDLPSVSS